MSLSFFGVCTSDHAPILAYHRVLVRNYVTNFRVDYRRFIIYNSLTLETNESHPNGTEHYAILL